MTQSSRHANDPTEKGDVSMKGKVDIAHSAVDVDYTSIVLFFGNLLLVDSILETLDTMCQPQLDTLLGNIFKGTGHLW